MKKKVLIIIGIILIACGCVFFALNTNNKKETTKQKIAMRKTHSFECSFSANDVETNILTTYTYKINTDKDYLISDANLISVLSYTDATQYEEAKAQDFDGVMGENIAYDDSKKEITITTELENISNEDYSSLPYAMYKDNYIPKDYTCKEVINDKENKKVKYVNVKVMYCKTTVETEKDEYIFLNDDGIVTNVVSEYTQKYEKADEYKNKLAELKKMFKDEDLVNIVGNDDEKSIKIEQTSKMTGYPTLHSIMNIIGDTHECSIYKYE